MKFPRRLPHFRSLKFAPLALLSLFLFTNLTGFLFSRVMAPEVVASPDVFRIPADIPTSGDAKLDRIIFEAGQNQGVDPRLLHAVIWQESKYKIEARSHVACRLTTRRETT
jgi:soluble lytic murein transglycosylase-like protein